MSRKFTNLNYKSKREALELRFQKYQMANLMILEKKNNNFKKFYFESLSRPEIVVLGSNSRT